MWSNKVDSKSSYSCRHFDSNIEEVKMETISARYFQRGGLKMCMLQLLKGKMKGLKNESVKYMGKLRE